jgi:cell division transport system ATP-binding protein
MNVWENIALPLYVAGRKEHEIEQRVTDLLNLIKLPDKADQFPSQLSGGEAQRVSIARALAVGPEVIFADEPTGNLDPETSRAIARLLRKINELGTTIMIATHDQDVLKDHQDIRHMILEKGELIKDTAAKKSAEVKKTDTTKVTKEEVSTTKRKNRC